MVPLGEGLPRPGDGAVLGKDSLVTRKGCKTRTAWLVLSIRRLKSRVEHLLPRYRASGASSYQAHHRHRSQGLRLGGEQALRSSRPRGRDAHTASEGVPDGRGSSGSPSPTLGGGGSRLDAEACPRGRALDANACSAASWRCARRRTTLAERQCSLMDDDFYKAATGTVIIRLSAVVTWGGP